MQKNTLLFLILSMAILIAYQPLLKMMGVEMPQAQKAEQTTPEETSGDTAGSVPAAVTPAAVTPAPSTLTATALPKPDRVGASAGAASVPAEQEQPAREIVVETDLYRAVFSTHGATVREWILQDYQEGDRTTLVNLINLPSTDNVVLPLSLKVDGIDGFDSGTWSADRNGIQVSGDQQATLRFSRTDPVSGATVTKAFTFHGDEYAVDLDVTTDRMDKDYTVSLGSNFGIHDWGKVRIGFVGTANLVDGDVTREDPDDMAQPLARTPEPDEDGIAWTVSEDKYFLAGLLPQTAPKAVVSQSLGEKHLTTALTMAAGTVGKFTLYAGPKEYYRLKALNADLQENIDFGWFMFGTLALVRMLAEPMFILLTIIDGYVGNYGVSIILLTLLIKTIFIPLTHKAYKSMKAMQAIQPQIKSIQKKYKDNKEKLSRETMSLYKEHKINPLGGCFPIFIQIPFFIAFFNILYTAIELRHAPFMGWIVDLSAKDPNYILPVIMGVSMFVQQKIQPNTMDPKQARIMLFLPIVFTFFFMSFPAGLVLYWLFNNLFTITQQFITRRYLEKSAA